MLGRRINEVMESVLSKALGPTDNMIKSLIEIELGYLNTAHPDFVGGTNTLMNMMRSQEEAEHEEEEYDERDSDAERFSGRLKRPEEIRE